MIVCVLLHVLDSNRTNPCWFLKCVFIVYWYITPTEASYPYTFKGFCFWSYMVKSYIVPCFQTFLTFFRFQKQIQGFMFDKGGPLLHLSLIFTMSELRLFLIFFGIVKVCPLLMNMYEHISSQLRNLAHGLLPSPLKKIVCAIKHIQQCNFFVYYGLFRNLTHNIFRLTKII